MTEHEARLIGETMRRLGIPGVAAPSGTHPDKWCIYDRLDAPRRDITNQALADVRDRTGGPTGALPTGGAPARGFVFPRLARG